MSNNLANT